MKTDAQVGEMSSQDGLPLKVKQLQMAMTTVQRDVERTIAQIGSTVSALPQRIIAGVEGFACSHPEAFVIASMPRRGMGKALKGAVEGSRADGPQMRQIDPVQEAAKKSKEYLQYDSVKVHEIAGDGRCLFRALAQGMARHQGRRLTATQEVQDADELRMAVHDALCRDEGHSKSYGDALEDIELHERRSLRQYCSELRVEGFWGGNPEMLVLAKMLKVPIYVYGAGADYGGGTPDFINLAKYGSQFSQGGADMMGRRPVRVLFTGNNHFDLLLPM